MLWQVLLDFIPECDAQERLASPLLEYACRFDNLLITPHLGGATFELMEKTETLWLGS